MHTTQLINKLKSDGYNVKSANQVVNNIGNVNIINAEKGKIFKSKLIIFTLKEFNDHLTETLIEFVRDYNKKNDLCVVFCNSNSCSDSTKTLYMCENGDGTCIIHFVYYDLNSSKFIYDLDFDYYKSSKIKELIDYATNNSELFIID